MTIEFKKVIPEPIKSNYNPESEIWNQHFKLEEGKEYIINAKSGKGKSTFIQIIYGIRKDFEGTILVNSENIKDLSNDALALLRQQNLSILFQDLRLFGDLSARDNILVNAALNISSPLHLIDKWASQLGISHLLEKQVNLLSYGERQRIALIRTLIQPFDWVLLDEPFSHLDLGNTKIAYQLIKQRALEQNAGILITTLGEDHFLEGEVKNL